MTSSTLAILQKEEVRSRTSQATLRVLQQRAEPAPRKERFLREPLFDLLRQIVNTILPQAQVGTSVDIADVIDRRLQSGTNPGWRYAELPPDPEAYSRGLAVFDSMLQQTPMRSFAAMPTAAREGYLRCIANGDVDKMAQFPLSTWMRMLRSDIVRAWVSHPQGMYAMQYYGFADGATGNEGWVGIGPNSAMPFEHTGTAQEGTSAAGQKESR